MGHEMESWERKMIEQAKEELQVLETQYPDRFDYLKLDLKSFIFLLESQLGGCNNGALVHSISSPTSTQASSCGKKRKRKKSSSGADWACELKLQMGSRDRVDVALERAQACLRKIQQVKTSFC